MTRLVNVVSLKKYYPLGQNPFSKSKHIKAVDGVSFSINERETFGLVGESGSGKSTLGLALLRMIQPTSGKVFIEDTEFTALKGDSLKRFRPKLSMVYQNPISSLDPTWTVEQSVAEPLTVGKKLPKSEVSQLVVQSLQEVGLPAYLAGRLPHELSGGQAQRVAIARALITHPKFVVLDEPTSALDVSVQAQLLNLLIELQAKFGLTYMFISHDLNVVGHLCDRMAVMYMGKIVEIGDAVEVFNTPLHPYTQALVSTVPVGTPRFRRFRLKGEPPSPKNPPPGCRFNTRCPYATNICKSEEPALIESSPGHLVACHNLDLAKSGDVRVPDNFGEM